MSNKSRHNKLYNYLVNTFGLSKEVILDALKDRIEDVIGKHVQQKLNSTSVEVMIRNKVAKFIKEGSVDGHYYDRKNFESLVKECLKEAVKEEVKKNYKLVVKEV